MLSYSNYKDLPESKSCYLDGRYFNEVLKWYDGLISEPILLNIEIDEDDTEINLHANIQDPKNNTILLGRIIINTLIMDAQHRHSNLILIDKENKEIWLLEPNEYKDIVNDDIRKIIREQIGNLLPSFSLNVISNSISEEDNLPSQCMQGGYCNAYIIKYALDYLSEKEYDPSDIKKFVAWVENNYDLPPGEPDVEFQGYYYADNSGADFALGALTGVALGGLLGGPWYGGWGYGPWYGGWGRGYGGWGRGPYYGGGRGYGGGRRYGGGYRR
ncbi:Hypothetical protein ORPV_780 [Orpheovirus IHUMI-LCC2]|uniref:Uncharacterized protein n=1 Tax=Orpheovirus IHUMI-LCC2 TaxID=2023057 RepID=A0A2I2L579_9VIRU|nr:Hypothetical protein ORPV_780 [Orpheovirus IHUMI-LCC2]SNW62684.1 Hypothetical protein ORPV_780 [Orpheovirus IHUMI-LCC2]